MFEHKDVRVLCGSRAASIAGDPEHKDVRRAARRGLGKTIGGREQFELDL